jgi:hypothetical protein
MVGEVFTYEGALVPEVVLYTILWNSGDFASTDTWGTCL